MIKDSPEYNLSRAKAQLILGHPFYASLLCNMPFVAREDIPTLAVDGKFVYYNPKYVAGLTINQIKFAEAHEVMHCVFKHLHRMQKYDFRKYNQAADYIINDMLVEDKVGEIHPNWLYNKALVTAGKTTEGVYALLPDDGSGGGSAGGGGDGTPQDNMLPPNKEDAGTQEQEWTMRAVQAAQVAKMHGKLSAGAKRFIDSIVQPKMPWRDILERFVSKRAKTDRSFSRPNRRFFPLGLYLPAMSGESLGRIAIAVDCSGSINDATLQEFAAEITAIKKLTNPSAIDVYYFDSEVSHEESYGPSDELDIKPHGGGGTAFSPVINAINSKAELPVACVFLTDLYCSDFGDAPDYPVLWVSNGRDTAPWGEVITMN